MLEEYVLRSGQLLTQHPMEVLLDTNTTPGAELKVLPPPIQLHTQLVGFDQAWKGQGE